MNPSSVDLWESHGPQIDHRLRCAPPVKPQKTHVLCPKMCRTNQQRLISMSRLLVKMLSTSIKVNITSHNLLRVTASPNCDHIPENRFPLEAAAVEQLRPLICLLVIHSKSNCWCRFSNQKAMCRVCDSPGYPSQPLLDELVSHFACRHPMCLWNACSSGVTMAIGHVKHTSQCLDDHALSESISPNGEKTMVV